LADALAQPEPEAGFEIDPPKATIKLRIPDFAR
jgi:hypothetical protein